MVVRKRVRSLISLCFGHIALEKRMHMLPGEWVERAGVGNLGQAQRSRKKRNTIRVYPKMWAPIAGKVGASAAEK